MKGFFSSKETKSKSRPDGRTYSCASCGLYQYVLSPRMESFGNFKKGILNLGEGPGEEEDKKGKQWQGKMGRALQRVYKKQGIDLFGDCLNINAVNCRPTNEKGGNRKPTDYEIACCRRRVIQIIEQYKPKVIVLLGGSALKTLLGHRWKKDLGGISKWRGCTIPDRDFRAWVCPVFHPSYVERQNEDSVTETIWEQDLERALGMMEVPFPKFPNEEKQIQIVQNKDEVSRVLRLLNQGSIPPDPQLMAFDIESTGLKPYDTSRHHISCISFCENPNHAYVIPAPKRRGHKKHLKDLLENLNIGKIAANMKFEDTWMNIIYGIHVTPWAWDTMQAAHILDNRPGITGLKFQTYVNFGIVDYDSEISGYLEAQDQKDGNSVNRIDELWASPEPRKKLMTYCGMDTIFTYKLALKQMKEMNFDPEELI